MFCMGRGDQDNTHQDSTAKKIQNYIFKYQDLLGKGNFGSAYCRYDVNTGKAVAIKVIKLDSIKSSVTEKLLQNQIEILKSLPNHQNLLKCYDVFTSVNNCYIVTELCESDMGEELKRKGRFRENQIKELVYGIYKGLEQLGRNSIIHRDIKISNIFYSKNKTPKIADFGFAVRRNNIFKDLNIGTPLYMSPQGLIDHIYGPKTDVWSFGVLLYELLHGQTPLERCTKDEQLKTQVLQPVRFGVQVSLELRQLIEACLTIDEARRPDIFQVAGLPYMRRLIKQFETQQISLKESSKGSTQCSEEYINNKINPHFFNKQLTYDTTLSLLHYCRLLHKANKKIFKSQQISQFIINFSFSLSKTKISSHNTFNQQLNKLRQVLQEYHSKFLMEYEDMRLVVNPKQILVEIDLVKRNLVMRQFGHGIEVLENQTRLFVQALEKENGEYFAVRSQAKLVLENGKFGL